MNDEFQSPAENRIESSNPGPGARAIRIAILAAVAVMIPVLYAWRQFHGIESPEAMEYAQLARNVARGEGFMTQSICPAEKWHLAKAGRPPSLSGKQSDIRHAPLHPLLLAGMFRLSGHGAGDAGHETASLLERRAILPLGILFTAATAVMVFLLGKRLFDTSSGLAAMFVYLLGDTVLSDSISGLPTSLAAFLATAASWAALAASSRIRAERPFLAWFPYSVLSAALCALCFLASYPALCLVPVFILFLAWRAEHRRWLLGGAWLLVFAAVAAPWLARNMAVSGNPAGLAPQTVMAGSRTYPGDSFFRSVAPEIDTSLAMKTASQKLRDNFARLYERDLKTFGSGFVLCFFFASFLFAFPREDVRQFRWCLAGGMVLMLCWGALYGESAGRVLRTVLPLLCIYGMAFFAELVRRLEPRDPLVERLALLAMAALTAVPGLFAVAGPGTPRQFHPYCISYVCGLVRPGDTVCSDAPWAVAWYADRVSVRIPQTVAEFTEMCEKDPAIGGLYLSRRITTTPYSEMTVDEKQKTWLPILNGWIPPENFPLTTGLRLPPDNDEIFLYRP